MRKISGLASTCKGRSSSEAISVPPPPVSRSGPEQGSAEGLRLNCRCHHRRPHRRLHHHHHRRHRRHRRRPHSQTQVIVCAWAS